MQQISCPGCGAPVQFKSAASVMVVCEFCKTTLLKDAESVRNIGKMSEVLEDFSPLQIGTSGQFGAHAFTLVGRLQLKYSDGYWNEWYALFEDGSSGWLADASGQFTLSFLKPATTTLPLFEKLVPGNLLHLGTDAYATSDVRTAQCTGGQGELPFKVGPGYEAKVADFRCADRFLTLDYSDADVRLYMGQAVTLTGLKAQLLREQDAAAAVNSGFHGKISALNCPSCGAPVNCVPGITVHISCPNCHAQVDTSGPVAEVLSAGSREQAIHFTLALGSEAMIDGARYTILGAMSRAESGDDSTWTEYFLYSPGRKFIWLVETSEGWQRAEVLDRWPQWDGSGHASLDGANFGQSSQYGARVVAALGSFNWRVSTGNEVQVTEYSGNRMRLAAEVSPEEMTWSRSVSVPLDQVRAWFGGHVQVNEQPHPKYMDSAKRMLIALLVINAIPLYFATGNSMPYALLAGAAIFLPAYFLDKLDAGGK
jgi:Domain of unknown function (DUF4178)